jgi:hypothetical protein
MDFSNLSRSNLGTLLYGQGYQTLPLASAMHFRTAKSAQAVEVILQSSVGL